MEVDGVDIKNKWYNRFLEKAAEAILVEEQVKEPDVVKSRVKTCWTCEFIDKKNQICTRCSCFLNVKTKSLFNININTDELEITHCPENFWADEYSKSFFKQK